MEFLDKYQTCRVMTVRLPPDGLPSRRSRTTDTLGVVVGALWHESISHGVDA